MDNTLFSSVIQNILHISIVHFYQNKHELDDFESRYCYNPSLQPMFTAENLSQVITDMENNILYESRDSLGICILLFRFCGEYFLAGPFVREEANDERIQIALIKAKLSATYTPSVKLYYNAFPLNSSSYVRNTILSCIRAFSGSEKDFAVCRIDDYTETKCLPRPSNLEFLDYSTIYHRYDLENRFLRLIELGDTENVLNALKDMDEETISRNRYINAIYQDPTISLSMLRSLARKAAERGGASVIEIDEITQHAVQKIVSSHHVDVQMKYMRTMVLELTEAVRRHKHQKENLSRLVEKTVEYIRFNFSRDFTLSHLAKITGVSCSYLSRHFKEETGITITQYITNLRCEYAAQMLQSSDIPIQDISCFVGYLDNNYFVKVFKKQYGMTPSQFRAVQKR